MKKINKTEIFMFDKPIGEPNIVYKDDSYYIERKEIYKKSIVWYGIGVNWKKNYGDIWREFNSNSGGWKPCAEPIYEKIYRRFDKLDRILNTK